jgi:5S rRNA maturation endonuclease (ribonuclease M5)
MDFERSTAFLKALGAKNIEAKQDQNWLRCSCPLARFTHQGQKDSNPSFALTLGVHDEPHFNCFACTGGTAAELLQMLELYVSQRPEYAGLYNFKLPEYTEFGNEAHKLVKPWPEEYLQSFMKAENVPLAKTYLLRPKVHLNEFGQKCRGFTPDELSLFDLRYDHSKGMVVFPYRDVYGRLAGMRGRSIAEKEHFDYTLNGNNNASLVWYNEPALELPGWVVVVEGQLDAIRVAARYHKVLANLTAKPTQYKLHKLLQSDGTILIPDNDAAGEKSIEKYREFHNYHKHPFRVLKLPDSVKDADDCSSDYLYDRINELTV